MLTRAKAEWIVQRKTLNRFPNLMTAIHADANQDAVSRLPWLVFHNARELLARRIDGVTVRSNQPNVPALAPNAHDVTRNHHQFRECFAHLLTCFFALPEQHPLLPRFVLLNPIYVRQDSVFSAGGAALPLPNPDTQTRRFLARVMATYFKLASSPSVCPR